MKLLIWNKIRKKILKKNNFNSLRFKFRKLKLKKFKKSEIFINIVLKSIGKNSILKNEKEYKELIKEKLNFKVMKHERFWRNYFFKGF